MSGARAHVCMQWSCGRAGQAHFLSMFAGRTSPFDRHDWHVDRCGTPVRASSRAIARAPLAHRSGQQSGARALWRYEPEPCARCASGQSELCVRARGVNGKRVACRSPVTRGSLEISALSPDARKLLRVVLGLTRPGRPDPDRQRKCDPGWVGRADMTPCSVHSFRRTQLVFARSATLSTSTTARRARSTRCRSTSTRAPRPGALVRLGVLDTCCACVSVCVCARDCVEESSWRLVEADYMAERSSYPKFAGRLLERCSTRRPGKLPWRFHQAPKLPSRRVRRG